MQILICTSKQILASDSVATSAIATSSCSHLRFTSKFGCNTGKSFNCDQSWQSRTSGDFQEKQRWGLVLHSKKKKKHYVVNDIIKSLSIYQSYKRINYYYAIWSSWRPPWLVHCVLRESSSIFQWAFHWQGWVVDDLMMRMLVRSWYIWVSRQCKLKKTLRIY